MTRAEILYNYPLWDIKRFFCGFLKYAKIHAKEISLKYGGNWRYYFIDMIWCNFRYGAMDSRDYLLFEFYKKSSRERNSYFTKRRYFRLIRTFDFDIFSKMLDKDYVNEHYSEFIKRKWIKVDDHTSEDEIKNFFNNTSDVIVKPLSSEQGRGIYKIKQGDSVKIEDFIKTHRGRYLLEEVVVNHPDIDKICSTSLNTVRVYTFVNSKGEVIILSSMLRCGIMGSEVDNWGSGGVGYIINKEGFIDKYGVDKKGNLYHSHPYTDIKMLGYKIPNYEELVMFVKAIIAKQSKVIFCGLDIAITPEGFELIEINFPGGHDFLQAFGVGFNKVLNG